MVNFHWQLGYDGSRRFNYLGTGNETVKQLADDPYYYLRTENIYAETGIDKFFGNHNIGLNLYYDAVRVSNRSGDFMKQELVNLDKGVLDWQHFGTAGLRYTFSHLNDKIVPTAGIHFSTTAAYTKNLEVSKSFNRYSGNLGLYIPLFKLFSLFINTGAATLTGDPEFYQLNNIGGNITLRGYIRNRFYGRTTFYDQNEFRWIPNFRSYIFNGKLGLIALYDLGRVWNPGEVSDTWHYGYGGGLMLVPFNKISATIYYSVSKEDKVVNLRVGKFF
jgi:hemolysin activation/secretion protein